MHGDYHVDIYAFECKCVCICVCDRSRVFLLCRRLSGHA